MDDNDDYGPGPICGPICDMCGGYGRVDFPIDDEWFSVECACQKPKVKRELRSIDAEWGG